MILVYTGNGKGKTSAAVGQVIRAYGHGYKVAFSQFLKRDGQAGEQVVLRKLLNKNFLAGGIGFFRNNSNFDLHRKKALLTLDWIWRKIKDNFFLVVADEILYALGLKLLLEEEIKNTLFLAKDCGVHLVLTGRGLPKFIEQEADLISEIKEVKHPFSRGISANKGIEF
ncbi:cob(I)yrinic acid a,c-diamide adenosyltransferase [Desulfonauticus submarinus]